MKFYLFITGCQYNYYDANNITHLLTKMGYIYTDKEKEANLIIVLACSIRQKPVDRLYGNIKKWKSFELKPKIIVLGCALKKDRKILSERVDLLTNAEKFENDLKILLKQENNQTLKQVNPKTFKPCSEQEIFPADAKVNTAYVPIMQGCNNYCTYCVVPYTRGREVSRELNVIIDEIKNAIKLGKKHIVLLGQNVNSYRPQKIKKSILPFAQLLKEIEKISEDFTYNFLTSNPHDFGDDIIDALSQSKKWERSLHLPVQSGDDIILKRMNRHYTVSQYQTLIKKLKKSCDGLTITTDIIVGFPGETDAQFDNTIKLCKTVGFAKVFVSQYSPRPGTIATTFDEKVSPITIKKRWTILNDLINLK